VSTDKVTTLETQYLHMEEDCPFIAAHKQVPKLEAAKAATGPSGKIRVVRDVTPMQRQP
jgi:hypothetical protein